MRPSILPALLVRLKALRANRGWTQEEFSENTGISYKYYQALEAGRKPDMRLSTLERLAAAYGIPLHELLTPETPDLVMRKRASSLRKRLPKVLK